MRSRILWLALLLASSADAKQESAGWVIVSKRAQAEALQPSERYDLLSLHGHTYLGSKGRDLVMRPKPASAIQLVKRDGTAIRCGDTFALRADGVFVIQGSVSLDTTSDARREDIYQWRIGNCKGQVPITSDVPIALVNLRVNDALVGCVRPWGLPLCWDEKQTLGTPHP